MDNTSDKKTIRKRGCGQIPQAAGALFFIIVSLAFVVLHVSVFSPNPVRPQQPVQLPADRSALAKALAPERVAERFKAISNLGSRAPGQKGLDATSEAIEKVFADNGLEIYSQVVDIPYPLLREGSGWISNETFRIDALPFRPNYVQTVTTGANGIDGELFLATAESIRNGRDFTGKIAVIDTGGSIFEDFDIDPVRYADIGFSAIIITHNEGIEKAPWDGHATTKTYQRNVPVNIVRLACDPEILNHIGEKVHIDVRSVWRTRRTRNVVGVMRGSGESTNNAVMIIPVEYDAFSTLPDLANGSFQALQTAVMLQLVEGLAPYRDTLKRDIVFAATTGAGHSQSGLSRLISTFGEYGFRDYPAEFINGKIASHKAAIDRIERIMRLFDDPDFAANGKSARTRELETTLDQEARRFLAQRHSALARKAVFVEAERLLQARIAYQRNPTDLASPEFAAFRAAKRRYDELNSLSALPMSKMLARPSIFRHRFPLPNGGDASYRDALRATLEYFAAFHEDQLRSFEADLKLERMFSRYGDIFALGTHCAPMSDPEAGEKIGLAGGRGVSTGEGLELFHTIVREAAHRLGIEGDVEIVKGGWGAYSDIFSDKVELNTMPFGVASYPAYTVCSVRERIRDQGYPFHQHEYENLETAQHMLSILGETALALADGRGIFNRLPIWGPIAHHGAVFAAGVGSSAIPNYPVEGAIVCSRDDKSPMITDPYGQYENQFMLLPVFGWLTWRPYDAFLFDENGVVKYVKDYGTAAQLIYDSKRMRYNNTPVNHVLYRGAPVTLLNRVNPQTLKSFATFEAVRRRGLTAFASTSQYGSDKVMMEFVPPDERFFMLLKDGAPDNEFVSTTRAFCLGTLHFDDPSWQPTENEIDGPGYLAADSEHFRDLSAEALASMSWLADKRLALQRRYGMADALTGAFDATAHAIATNVVARASEMPYLERQREYGNALSYQMLNHPVIRNVISEAVAGILWYLGLLVPFTFFFEKLIFGFADIRRRLMVQGITFLVAFALLRILHPAFHMIRSSAMILLGFVIMLTVGMVALVLSGKFKENLDALRGGVNPQGVTGNKLGIAITAFLLGLNNMHRRRMRTGLTCATLALMTFVMTCFMSVQSNIVETERATGSAPYQGLVIRKKQMRPIYGAEIDAIRLAFPNHRVSRRNFYAAFYNHATQIPDSPTFKLEIGEGEYSRTRSVRTALGFEPQEPLAPHMPLLSTNGWFTVEQKEDTEGPRPVIVSDVLAEQLGITPKMVDDAPVPVMLNGKRFVIYNIFDSEKFDEVKDQDGENLLPYDGLAMNNPKFYGWCIIIADDTDPRVAAADLILVLNDDLEMDYRGIRTASLAIDMGNVPYAVAKNEISMYKEQSGQECSYGLDGTSYHGRRARSRSLIGFADLLIPLLIAAITVLNTMKGSVYERRNEIYVYNAVGIAPKYIFFMFVAEALVYAVVGTVVGCLLAQGVGRILAILGVTAGLDMNFASLTTVYASLAIAAATLFSTWFPARTAMEIAKPADNAGWSLPEPDADDSLSLLLPFTFTHFDRIAVLAFFHDFFDGFGEGSAGIFFAGEPQLKIADRLDDLADNAYIPALEVRVWLKPFDLGVSQRIEIELGTDPDTKEFIAKMILTRISGTRESWMRLNKPFVAAVRRQFLHWRAVDDEQKAALFAEAQSLLRRAVKAE